MPSQTVLAWLPVSGVVAEDVVVASVGTAVGRNTYPASSVAVYTVAWDHAVSSAVALVQPVGQLEVEKTVVGFSVAPYVSYLDESVVFLSLFFSQNRLLI